MSNESLLSDNMFYTAEPLYDKRGVYLDMSQVPLIPEKLLDFVTLLKRLRLNSLVVHWGNLFPWRFEERVQSTFAYPDQVISGFYEKLRKEHIDSYTLIPAPERLSFILSLKSFQHLRKSQRDVDRLDIDKPAARQLVLEMIEDLLNITDFSGLFIESEGVQESRIACEKGGMLIPPDASRDYFNHLIESSLLAGGKVLWQIPEKASEDTMKVFGDKIERASFNKAGNTWKLCPIDGREPIGFSSCRGILFIPKGEAGGFTFPMPLNRQSLHFLVLAALGAWNGKHVIHNLWAKEDAPSGILLSGLENPQRDEFILLLDNIYRLSRELKEQHTVLLALHDSHTTGDAYTWELVSKAAKVENNIRDLCEKKLLREERMVNPKWLDRWFTLKLLPALEDLSTAAIRLRSLLELSNNEPVSQRG